MPVIIYLAAAGLVVMASDAHVAAKNGPDAGTGGHVIILTCYWNHDGVVMIFQAAVCAFLLIFGWRGDLQGPQFVINLTQHHVKSMRSGLLQR